MTITDNKFKEWLRLSRRGDQLEYFRGNLADAITKSKQPALVGSRAWTAYELGMVTLVQKRHGPDDYSYKAVRK